jgi:hypothetical protein
LIDKLLNQKIEAKIMGSFGKKAKAWYEAWGTGTEASHKRRGQSLVTPALTKKFQNTAHGVI